MMTKTIIPLTLALICALLFNGFALAAEGSPQLGVRAAYGEVLALNPGGLTIQKVNSEVMTFQVDEGTRFRAMEIDEPAFDDLQVGGKVAIVARTSNEGESIAKLVIVLPQDFNPSQWAGVRVRGEIAHIDVNAKTFTVQTQNGEEITFLVDDLTRFYGQISDLSDLQIGWKVAVGGIETEDGVLAKLIAGIDPEKTIMHTGDISEVNPAVGTFTLVNRQGEEWIITVDENTNYRSRGDEIQVLNDLSPDMVAIVVAITQDDGVLLATRVAAADDEELPNYDVKIGGTIMEVDDNSLTIQTQTGEEIVFIVDDETIIRGRGGISSLNDLQVGMIAGVGGYENDGEYPIAKLVIVRQAQAP